MQKTTSLSSHHGFEWIKRKGVFMKSFIKHSKGSLRASLRGPTLGPPKVRSVGQFQHYLLEWKLTVIGAGGGRPEFEARGDECVRQRVRHHRRTSLLHVRRRPSRLQPSNFDYAELSPRLSPSIRHRHKIASLLIKPFIPSHTARLFNHFLN